MTPDEAKKLTVPKLKAELDKLGLSTDGLKAALLERLLQALSAPPAANTERVVYVQFDGGADNASMQYLCQRDWCSTLVKAADLEVLTPRGAAALKPLPRIDTVKQLFAGFANRSMAYDLPHVIGLTTFGSEVVRVRQLTEAFESFRRAVDRTAANGQTKLFDALEMARAELATFCDGLANAPPEGVLKRILVLTDGEDTASDIEAHDVSAALQREGVIVDSVVIGNDTSSTEVSTSCTERSDLRCTATRSSASSRRLDCLSPALPLLAPAAALNLGCHRRLRLPPDKHSRCAAAV